MKVGKHLTKEPKFFCSFKVVIASSLDETELIGLSRNLFDYNIPFVYCLSNEQFASVRVQFNRHSSIESNVDSKESTMPMKPVLDSLKGMEGLIKQIGSRSDGNKVPENSPNASSSSSIEQQVGSSIADEYAKKSVRIIIENVGDGNPHMIAYIFLRAINKLKYLKSVEESEPKFEDIINQYLKEWSIPITNDITRKIESTPLDLNGIDSNALLKLGKFLNFDLIIPFT